MKTQNKYLPGFLATKENTVQNRIKEAREAMRNAAKDEAELNREIAEYFRK